MSLSKLFELFVELYDLYNLYKISKTCRISKTNTEQFIERVKSFDLIYNKRNSSYNNSKDKEKIWEQISKEFNCDAKKKWTLLRDKYVREKKKRIKSLGSEAEYFSQWEFYNRMSFVNNHIKPRGIENNDSMEETETVDIQAFYNEFCRQITGSDLCESNPEKSLLNSYDEQQKFKVDPVQEDFLETLKIFEKKIKYAKPVEENDEDSVFIQVVANRMKKMSSSGKLNFQQEVLRMIEVIVGKN